MSEHQVIELATIPRSELQEQLTVEYYFDFKNHPFRHQDLLLDPEVHSVIAVLERIHSYANTWLEEAITEKMAGNHMTRITADTYQGNSVGYFDILVEDEAEFEPGYVVGAPQQEDGYTLYVEQGASVIGANMFLDSGNIFIGAGTIVEPGSGIKGPTIIGKHNEIRGGAYFRGNVITGDQGTFRGELKNAVMMDGANFPHPSYVGDSVCGYKTHFGNQATTANLGIYAGVFGKQNILVRLDGKTYDLGRPKIGIILGDYSQVGCNSVSDPGVFLAPNTIVYQLCRINKGFYGPQEVIKYKPLENKVIERDILR